MNYTNSISFAPEGWHTVTVRIVVDDARQLIEFLRHVFQATGEYGDRRCMVEDKWGNTWQIASQMGKL